MPTPTEPLASNLRAEMARRRLSQTETAAHIGLSYASFNDRLRGRTPFSVDQLLALANLFGVGVSDLVANSAAQGAPA